MKRNDNKNKYQDKQYFDSYEFNKTRKLGYFYAMDIKEQYDDYFFKYPRDYTSYPYYASFLMKYGYLDEALSVLDYGYNLSRGDHKFMRSYDKVKYLDKYYYLYKLKIMIYKENYMEALNIYYDHYEILKESITESNAIIMYCKKKVGEVIPDRKDGKSYLYRQVIEYQESDFLDHIKKHLANDAINMENASSSIFVPEFPINDVFNEIKKYIPSKNCLYPGGIEDAYIFKYNECGRDKYRLTNYFKVFCFHNSKEFITMTPSVVNEKVFPCIDLNYLKNDKDDSSYIKSSQIDKFLNKYKKLSLNKTIKD